MSISDIPRQELCILVANVGRSLCDDPQRCEALLRDYCGTYRREIALLVNAMREQVPAELMSTEGKVPYAILRSRLVKKLEENLAITTEAAEWSVDAWAAALEINTPTASSSSSASLSVNSGGTRVEQFNTGGNSASNADSGYKPTEVAGGTAGSGAVANSGGYNSGNYTNGGNYGNQSAGNNYSGAASGGASTQIRPDLPPPAPPNTYNPYAAAPPPPPGGRSKPNYLLFGILGGVGVLGLFALIGILAIIGSTGSPEMRAALKEAKAMRTNGQYSDCVDALKEYQEYSQAKEFQQLCRLDLAKQYAKEGRLIRAIREAKLISEATDEKSYKQARDLIANWSEGRQIKFRNSCNHPIEIALMFSDPSSSTNKPKPDGWWKLEPGDFSILSSNGTPIRVLDPVFYYAQVTDNSGWYWEGDKSVTLGGKVYRMRNMQPKIDPKDGSFVQTLTCNAR
jgi:hypothetical protein